jgi:hypothetical protein
MALTIFIIAMLFVYFYPSWVGRKRRNRLAIFVTNLLFGWSLIGWGIALIWAFKHEEARA